MRVVETLSDYWLNCANCNSPRMILADSSADFIARIAGHPDAPVGPIRLHLPQIETLYSREVEGVPLSGGKAPAMSPANTSTEVDMIEATPIRPPEDETVAQVSKMLLDYEVSRRRAPVVISVGNDSNGKLTFNVERGHDKLRDALKHPRAIKADIVARPRLAAAPAQGQLWKAS
jgi:hypothetical protein